MPRSGDRRRFQDAAAVQALMAFRAPSPLGLRGVIDDARAFARSGVVTLPMVERLLDIAEAARLARNEDTRKSGYSASRWSALVDNLWRKLDDLAAIEPTPHPLGDLPKSLYVGELLAERFLPEPEDRTVREREEETGP